MFATCVSSLAKASAGRKLAAAAPQFARRTMVASKLGDRDASHAWNKSCYSGIDYTIDDESTVLQGEEVWHEFNSDLLTHFTHLSPITAMHFFRSGREIRCVQCWLPCYDMRRW